MIHPVGITTNIPKNCVGAGFQLATPQRPYCLYDKDEMDYFVSQRENGLPILSNVLLNSDNEAQITGCLFILNNLLDNGVKDIYKLYPVLSRFNNTNSASIQTYLAGIYRKIQVPDAFGPLVNMLIKNSKTSDSSQKIFDPNEEIGGAILSYISDKFKG